MIFFHVSDLHIGKQLNGYSLMENQREVLGQIVGYARQYQPDAILICGDIYDKSIPSGEAYTMFGQFLEALAKLRPQIEVMIIAGNHDSPERLAYAGSFLEAHHIYLSVLPPKSEQEFLKKVTLQDAYGEVDFYLLPFMKPGYVRTLFWDEPKRLESYEAAVQGVVEREKLDHTRRNVILSHQFYTGTNGEVQTCDSEHAVLFAGGLDQIRASVLDPFDYAALGHLHGAQKVGREEVRYCGTPYKYSVSEERHRKSVTMVSMRGKGEPIQIETLPLKGIQDVRRERGTLEELLARGRADGRHDFVSVTVTEEEEPYRVRERLEEVYDHLLELRMDHAGMRTRWEEKPEEIPVLCPEEVFVKFYRTVRGQDLTEAQEERMRRIIQEAREEEER